jgi:hypothetical protein
VSNSSDELRMDEHMEIQPPGVIFRVLLDSEAGFTARAVDYPILFKASPSHNSKRRLRTQSCVTLARPTRPL